MPIAYKDKFIVPAPTVSINSNFDRFEDGTFKKVLFSITLKGKLFPNADDGIIALSSRAADPTRTISILSSENNRQDDIQKQIASLYAIFDPAMLGQKPIDLIQQSDFTSNEAGGLLKIIGWNTNVNYPLLPTSTMECWARVKSIEIPEGPWNNFVEYTVQLESDYLRVKNTNNSGAGDIVGILDETLAKVPVEETWSFESADEDERFFKMSRSVTAQSVGRRFSATKYVSGWVLARDSVSGAIGGENSFGNVATSGSIYGSSGTKLLRLSSSGSATASVFLFSGKELDFIQGTGTAEQFQNFVIGSGGYICYNPKRTTNVDKNGGKFTVTEGWSCATRKSFYDNYGFYSTGTTNGSFALEDFKVDFSDSAESNNLDITIDGTITGVRFLNTDGIKEKFATAENRFSNLQYNNYDAIKQRIKERASGLFPTGVYPSGILKIERHNSLTVGKNPIAGTITYNMKFSENNLPNVALLTCTGISDNTKKALALVKRHNLSIADDGPAHMSAETSVLNRAAGPIIHAIGSTSKMTRTVNIEINFDKMPTGTTNVAGNWGVIIGPVYMPTTQDIFEAYNCLYNLWDSEALKLYGPLFLDKVSSTFDPISGKWTGNITITASN